MQRAGLGTALALAIGAFCWANAASAETPAEWAKLGARVHGGYGSFIPLGIKIGLDAATKLKAAPRSLVVTYYDNPKSPCACFADGVAIATTTSFGQRSMILSAEKAPDDKAAVMVIRPRAGGAGLKYSIPMAVLPRLAGMNSSMNELQRHEAVMKDPDLFQVEPAP